MTKATKLVATRLRFIPEGGVLMLIDYVIKGMGRNIEPVGKQILELEWLLFMCTDELKGTGPR